MYENSQYSPPMIVNSRAGQEVAEANIKIGDMTGKLAELEIKLQAMYSVMIEQGIDPKLFDAKIEEIVNNRSAKTPTSQSRAQKKAKQCPECGVAVKQSTEDPLVGRCLYCGAKVTFYPSFTEE